MMGEYGLPEFPCVLETAADQHSTSKAPKLPGEVLTGFFKTFFYGSQSYLLRGVLAAFMSLQSKCRRKGLKSGEVCLAHSFGKDSPSWQGRYARVPGSGSV